MYQQVEVMAQFFIKMHLNFKMFIERFCKCLTTLMAWYG
jgi:hypothetical protein